MSELHIRWRWRKFRKIRVNEHVCFGERPGRHVLHLLLSPLAGLSCVHCLFQFPKHDAQRQEEEKVGEENREKHKEVNMRLILAEEYVSEGLVMRVCPNALENNVETSDLQAVDVVRESDHKAILDVLDQEECVWLHQGDETVEVSGVLSFERVLLLCFRGNVHFGLAGDVHRPRVSERTLVVHPLVLVLPVYSDRMESRQRVHVNGVGVIERCEIHVDTCKKRKPRFSGIVHGILTNEMSKITSYCGHTELPRTSGSDVKNDADVDVQVLGLHDEEDGSALEQRRRRRVAVHLRLRVEAVVPVH